MTMIRPPRQVVAPKMLQSPRSGTRLSLHTPPPSMISDEELSAAIALHGEMMAKFQAVVAEIAEAEKAIRAADAQDLRQRAAAELAGTKDPGAVETDKVKKQLAKLADRRLVLTQATDDAAVAVANLVERRRTELLEATATELEPVRREYLETIEKLEGLHRRMTSIQATRGWMASFPGGSRSTPARSVKHGSSRGASRSPVCSKRCAAWRTRTRSRVPANGRQARAR